MTNTEIIKKTLEYNRTAFEKAFETITTVQEEGRKAVGEALKEASFMPAEGKAVVQQWLEASKEAGEKLRETVLKGHEKIEQYL